MSDCVLILVKDGDEYCAVGCYLHWMGAAALSLIDSAVPRMRKGNVGQSMARLIGTCHEILMGNTGMVVVTIEKHLLPYKDKECTHWKTITLGEAGVVVYDCTSGMVECHAGYLEKDKDNGTCIGVPPE